MHVGSLIAKTDTSMRDESCLDRYAEGPGTPVDPTLQEPTAREVAVAYLHQAGRVGARAAAHPGCRTIRGAPAADATVAARIRERFRRAHDGGDLPPDADPDLLAQYLMTVSDGIAVQAGDGLDTDALHQVADLALQAWPTA